MALTRLNRKRQREAETLRILAIHNYYQQRGGEEECFAAETALLRQHGHDVIPFTLDNATIDRIPKGQLLRATLWNRAVYRELRQIINTVQPDVAHFHNIFPLISPAAYSASQAEGVPVIKTLHNYRLLCPASTFLRQGRSCESCQGKLVTWPSVVHACYRQSRTQTSAVTLMLLVHRLLRTWQNKVDLYIVPSQFALQKHVEGGLPPEKMVIKPNIVYPDPGPGEDTRSFALFVGRLAPEKGIDVLLDAWSTLHAKVPLTIVGDGPLGSQVSELTHRYPKLVWEGRQPLARVHDMMKRAAFLVMPSISYETFGRVIVEAFAAGTPVVSSELGAMTELVEANYTGLHVSPGSKDDLRRVMTWAWAHLPQMAEMGRNARREFEEKYSPQKNYQELIDIYNLAISRKSTPRGNHAR